MDGSGSEVLTEEEKLVAELDLLSIRYLSRLAHAAVNWPAPAENDRARLDALVGGGGDFVQQLDLTDLGSKPGSPVFQSSTIREELPLCISTFQMGTNTTFQYNSDTLTILLRVMELW